MHVHERFGNRVANYIRYRPHYPAELAAELERRGVLRAGLRVADIGSGTGISAKVFLDAGCDVIGIEPNREMREAGNEWLKEYKTFSSVATSAEETGLDDASIDLVFAGQAFHWFKHDAFRKECLRILKPGGNSVLAWNDRQTDTTDFLKAYEDLLQYFGTDYKEVNHKNVSDEKLDAFFGKENWQQFSLPNHQDFTFEGLKGRLFSSSYVPAEDHPDSAFMVNVLKKIFLRYQENGTVRFLYDTKVYYGTLKA